MSETESVEPRKPRLREAFERVAPDLAGVQKRDLRKITLNVPEVVATIIGALPQIREFRPQILDELPKYNIVLFDRIEELTLALAYAHGNWLAARQPQRSREEMGEEAVTLRNLMLADAQTQMLRKIFNKEVVADLQSGTGYQDTANDLLGLVSLYRTNWTAIGGQTAVSPAGIELAEILADQLLTDLGVRMRRPLKRSAAVDERLRAFALCVRGYNHARRAIQYLRFEEGDAEEIAPSLYAGRSKPAVLEEEDLGSEPDSDEMDPGAENEAAGANASTSPSPSEFDPRVGMPGSNPFTE